MFPRRALPRGCLTALGATRGFTTGCLVLLLVVAQVATGCRDDRSGTPVERFRAAAERLVIAADTAGMIAAPGSDGWFFLAAELRHVAAGRFWGADAARASRAPGLEQADPLPAILDFHRQLKAVGVELLLMPVPPKAVIRADAVDTATPTPMPLGRLDPDHQAFYALLRERGVDVLDLTDLFLGNRDHAEGPLYCRQDSHWSGVGCTLAAAALATRVRERSWYSALARTRFSASWFSTEISGDLLPRRTDAVQRERLRLRRVAQPVEGGRPVAVAPDRGSPIVLLGDSHNLVFHAGGDMHAAGAGLPDQLALELGLAVDVVAVRGSGATSARLSLRRRAQAEPDFWSAKRLVIWCFAAREFTEGDGWDLVPVVE